MFASTVDTAGQGFRLWKIPEFTLVSLSKSSSACPERTSDKIKSMYKVYNDGSLEYLAIGTDSGAVTVYSIVFLQADNVR